MRRITEWKNKLLLTGIYAGILIIFWALHVPCLFEHFLHIPCPGCGMSHAVFSALKLDFKSAFISHPMFWSMPILYAYFLLDFRILKKKVLHYVILGLIGLGFCVNWFVNLVDFCRIT